MVRLDLDCARSIMINSMAKAIPRRCAPPPCDVNTLALFCGPMSSRIRVEFDIHTSNWHRVGLAAGIPVEKEGLIVMKVRIGT